MDTHKKCVMALYILIWVSKTLYTAMCYITDRAVLYSCKNNGVLINEI